METAVYSFQKDSTRIEGRPAYVDVDDIEHKEEESFFKDQGGYRKGCILDSKESVDSTDTPSNKGKGCCCPCWCCLVSLLALMLAFAVAVALHKVSLPSKHWLHDELHRLSASARLLRRDPSAFIEQMKAEVAKSMGWGRPELVTACPPQPVPLPAPRPSMPPARSSICNMSAPIPLTTPPRRWDVGPSWLRMCELKTRAGKRPAQRNWCWVGVKNSCHANLKHHHSWHELRDMAARWGDAPPRSVEPFEPLEDAHLCDNPDKGRKRNWTAQEREEARTWFRDNVAVYVLGLFSDTERWQMISQRLHELRIWATHVPGVDMRAEGAIEDAKAHGWVPQEFNFTRAQDLAYTREQEMGSILGTLGCASAHFKAQTKVIADGYSLAVVFEDDSWPEEDFVERLWSIVRNELPCDWEVTTLYSRCPYGRCVSDHLSRVQPDGNEPDFLCRHGVNWGMQAVLYRTEVLARVQKLWKQIVFNENRPHCMDVDVALASISDQVGYYAVPASQKPGLLKETDHPSLRWSINVQGAQMKTFD